MNGRVTSLLLMAAANLLSTTASVSFAQDVNIADKSTESIVKESVLGPVTATISVMPAKPMIGDVITVSIDVVSEPLVEILMPEFGEALDRYRILDFAPTQSIRDDGKTHSKQTYRLQPPMSGKQSIPPILVEFVDGRPGHKPSPDDYDAFELLTPRIDFVVESVTPTNATTDLKPPLGELQINASTTQVLSPRNVIWLAVLTAVLVGAAWFWLKSRPKSDPQLSAYQIARQRLDTLLQKPLPSGDENVDAFYVELSDIVRRYLEDRFELRAPELTTEEFLEAVIESPDLHHEHQQLLRQFLRQADLVKFAGVAPDAATIQASIASANRFIDETQPSTVVEAANG